MKQRKSGTNWKEGKKFSISIPECRFVRVQTNGKKGNNHQPSMLGECIFAVDDKSSRKIKQTENYVSQYIREQIHKQDACTIRIICHARISTTMDLDMHMLWVVRHLFTSIPTKMDEQKNGYYIY